MSTLHYVSALVAFVGVMLYLFRQRRAMNKALSTMLSTSTTFRAALVSASHSFVSSLQSSQLPAGCTRACSELTLLPGARPDYKRDPDIWLDDEILNVRPDETSDTE